MVSEREGDPGVYYFEDWCKNALICVRTLADAKGQHEAWVDGKLQQKHIWCDIGELLCSFVDDCNLDMFFAAADSRLAPLVVKRLRALKVTIDSRPSELEGMALYESCHWHRVQAAAQSVLTAWDPPSWPWR